MVGTLQQLKEAASAAYGQAEIRLVPEGVSVEAARWNADAKLGQCSRLIPWHELDCASLNVPLIQVEMVVRELSRAGFTATSKPEMAA